ncbi:uncharacterized protein [Palaemon carinicauda]|uniref:uncharacterized protein n=1 Tax=Palaemon carinicauda TaxID=392227 RepID=UPI0035B648DF
MDDICSSINPEQEGRQLTEEIDALLNSGGFKVKDTSQDAFGACSYIRFVVAKSRVASLKQLTIPRLELQAAVLAVRLAKTIKDECRFQISKTKFFVDSQMVFFMDVQVVSAKFGEIQSLSDPSEWCYVLGTNNVAND